MSEIKYVRWEELELLASTYKQKPISGVYLFVYKNRIIYIGESTNIAYRVKTHKKHMLRGGFSSFKVDDGNDIYSLMSIQSEEEYRELSKKGIVWIPSNSKDGKYWKHNYKDVNYNFNDFWFEYINSHYIHNLTVYATEITNENIKKNEIIRQTLESQLQIALREKFKIGYYTNTPNNSWLGKEEIVNEERRLEYKFNFTSFPEVDNCTKELLMAKFLSGDK